MSERIAFDPPHYEWRADTVEQALNTLGAARKILEAYLVTLNPGAGLVDRDRLARVTPADLTLLLDMSGLVGKIREAEQFSDLIAGVDVPAPE
jgi:hypothetical protein